MTDDLLQAALAAMDGYFRGEFASKRSIRQDMETLRAIAFAEQKKRQAADTQRIEREK